MEIASYTNEFKRSILDLFAKSFGKELPENVWNWRYEKNPFSEKKLIELMLDGDVVAGHYALWPVELEVEEEIISSAMSMTTMTHPDYGGRGIFTKLADSVYQSAFNESHIKLVWGFPNANSHYGFIKRLKWKDIGTIPMLSIDNEGMERYPSIDFKEKKLFNDVDAAKLKSNSDGMIRLRKSAEYLNWRYFDNPMFQYQVLTTSESNFVVIKFFKSFLDSSQYEIDIVEWCVEPDLDSIVSLLSAIKTYAVGKDMKVSRVNTWMNIFDKRHILLEKVGFKLAAPITMLGGLTIENTSNLLNYSHWDISMGNSDVF